MVIGDTRDHSEFSLENEVSKPFFPLGILDAHPCESSANLLRPLPAYGLWLFFWTTDERFRWRGLPLFVSCLFEPTLLGEKIHISMRLLPDYVVVPSKKPTSLRCMTSRELKVVATASELLDAAESDTPAGEDIGCLLP